MILLNIFLFSLISGDTSLTEPHKHDRENFNYFTLQIPKQKVFNLGQVEAVLNLEHVQQIGALEDWHLFRRAKLPSADLSNSQFTPVAKFSRRAQQVLNSINHFEEAEPRELNKRASIGKDREGLFPSLNMTKYDELGIKDPGFGRQWHFHNTDAPGNDFNVTKLWEDGITGKNVIVGIIDDGIDYEHNDIKDNFYAESSYDFNDARKLPMPMLKEDTHGTRCAGQIAGVKNDACGIGIAHEAKVAGIRILSKEISADQEAHAIGYGMQTNEIYSCSWGPPDDGRAMDRPPPVAQAALENAIQKGRGGKGNIYVFASGNGGFQGDDCNYDGYTNSIYSITVGSVDAFHNHPGYSESCTALLVSAYSSGVLSHRIYTSSSWHNQCTDEHGGTSAAAPFVAGVAALALQVRPDLTWRDMQYVSVKSAIPINTKDSSWDRTAVGRWYSPAFGYGKIDAYQFVQTAKAHELVRPQVKINSDVIRVARPIPEGQGGISSSFVVTRKMVDEAKFGTVEHVTVTLNVQHQSRNNVRVTLKSPSNVVSTVIVPRPYDTSNQGYPDWRAMTVKHWSEDPLGDWTITVTDEMDPFATGLFVDWRVTIYGEQAKTPVEIKPTKPNENTEDEELKPSKAVEEKETETSKPDPLKTPEEQTESDKKDSETSEDSKKEADKESKEESKPTEPKKDESKKDGPTEKTEPAEGSELVVDNSETEENKSGFSTFSILILVASGLGFIVLTTVAYRRYRGYSHLPKSQDLEMLDTPNEPHSPYHDDSVEVAFEAGLSDSDNDGDNSSFTPLVHSNSGNNFRKNDDLV